MTIGSVYSHYCKVTVMTVNRTSRAAGLETLCLVFVCSELITCHLADAFIQRDFQLGNEGLSILPKDTGNGFEPPTFWLATTGLEGLSLVHFSKRRNCSICLINKDEDLYDDEL